MKHVNICLKFVKFVKKPENNMKNMCEIWFCLRKKIIKKLQNMLKFNSFTMAKIKPKIPASPKCKQQKNSGGVRLVQ